MVQVNKTVDKYCVCSATFWIPLDKLHTN